jgi:tyrosyl-tRNA synthetase
MYESAARIYTQLNDIARAASLYSTLANFLNSKRWGKERADEFRQKAKELTERQGGAIWLDETMLAPYEYWQFWRNTEDADVGRFLRLFTDLSESDVGKLEKLQGAELNDAKKILATEATALCHGRDAANAAAETARRTFEEGKLAEGLPTFEIERARFEAGIAIATLAHLTKLTGSTGEARRFIQGGGLRVNDVPVSDVRATVTHADLTPEGVLKLSIGKKQHILIKPV